MASDDGAKRGCLILLDELPAAGADGLIEIPIAVTGTWKRVASQFSLTKQDLAQMAANFKKRKNGEINIDYDHASEMPEVAKGGPVPSAGRIVKVRSNGALYAGVEFTARALEMIKTKEYRFVSPAIAWGVKDKTTGEDQGTTLTSLALTNRPFLEELPTIKLSEIARLGSREFVSGRIRPADGSGIAGAGVRTRAAHAGIKLSIGAVAVNGERVKRIKAMQAKSAKSGEALSYTEARAITLSEERAAGIDLKTPCQAKSEVL